MTNQGAFRLTRRSLVGAGAAALAMPGVLRAQTLDELKKRNVVRVGIPADNSPWGSVDGQGNPLGFDIEVTKLYGKYIGIPLEMVRVTTPNRISQLLTGKVDVLITVMGMYPDRAKVVQFSKPYSNLDIMLIGRKDVKASAPEDLGKIRVGAPRASAQDIAITKIMPAGSQVQRFDDDATAIQALISGQVDVLGANSTYLGTITRLKPDHNFESKMTFNRQYNGICIRPGQTELLKFTNDFIDKITASGELAAVYKQWLNAELPDFPKTVEGVPFV